MPRLVKEKESGLASLALQGPGVLLLLGGLAGAASSFVLNPLGPLRDWIISPLLGGLIAGVGLGLMLAGTLCGVEMGLTVANVPHRDGGVLAGLDVLSSVEGQAARGGR